jgi:translation initiation factor IF-3
MIKLHKTIKYIYPFKQQKKIFLIDQNSLNSITSQHRFLSSSQNFNFNFSLSSLSYQKNRKPRDEEIKSQYIRYVDLEGQLQGTYPLKKILSSFDRTKYWLVQVSPVDIISSSKNSSQQLSKEQLRPTREQFGQHQEPPVCKLVPKQDLQKLKKQKKSTTQMLKKELKLTWKVSPNDLTHKLLRAKEWLEKGYQLQVVISDKVKRGQSDQDKSVLDRIIKELSQFTNEIKVPKWIGSGVIIEMQGKINTHNDDGTDIVDGVDVVDVDVVGAINTTDPTLEKEKKP